MRTGALERIGLVAWCAGILASIGLTVWLDFADVGNAVASVGWGMPFVALTRVATISVAGVGWWLLLPASGRFKLRSALLLRFIREGVNTLLPLTQVGGDVVGARLSTFWAVPSSLATAGIIIDVLYSVLVCGARSCDARRAGGRYDRDMDSGDRSRLGDPNASGILPRAAPERASHSLLRAESFKKR